MPGVQVPAIERSSVKGWSPGRVGYGLASAEAVVVIIAGYANHTHSPAAVRWLIAGALVLVFWALLEMLRWLLVWGRTSRAERTLYRGLAVAGIILFGLGLWAETTKWAGTHGYLIGLMDIATGFCFGIPVAGVFIGEISRRAAESADKHIAITAVNSQLTYLLKLVEAWPPPDTASLSDWLQKCADSAGHATLNASAKVDNISAKLAIFSMVSITVTPSIQKENAAELRWTVANDELWASLGFSCGRLATDLPRLMAVLYPPTLQAAVPGWLNNLAGALQRLLVTQLPARYKWLPEALKESPQPVPETFSILLSPSAPAVLASSPWLASGITSAPNDGAKELASATEERARDALKNELGGLEHLLRALAKLIDAAGTATRELSDLLGARRPG